MNPNNFYHYDIYFQDNVDRYMQGFEAYEQFIALNNQEFGGSGSGLKKKRTYIPCQREEVEQRLLDDYLEDEDTPPKYPKENFRRRFSKYFESIRDYGLHGSLLSDEIRSSVDIYLLPGLNCPQLDHEDLEQLDEFDLEEMDLKWQRSQLRFDKNKVELVRQLYRQGIFAKECKNQGKSRYVKRRDAWTLDIRMGVDLLSRSTLSLVIFDGRRGVDWTKSYAKLKKLYDAQREQLSDASIEIKAYTQGLKKVEAQLVAHQQGQLWFVTAGGMHDVPPPKGQGKRRMSSGPDVEIDYSQFTYGPKQSQTSESETQTSDFDTCESDCSVETHESLPEPTVNEPKVVTQPKGWDMGLPTQKHVFVCGSLSHLIRRLYFFMRNKDGIKRLTKQTEGHHELEQASFSLLGISDFMVAMLLLEEVRVYITVKICDKNNKVLFTDSECLVLSPEFKLPDAISTLEDDSWVNVMQEELLQFKIQKVWILVDLPYGKKAIGTKWVYRNKKDERGVVVRNKARIFLSFASYMGFIVYQMDVKSAFLYGKIDEEVYVSQPLGFIDPKNGYRRGTIDKTLFIKKDKHDIILVQVYVDDIIFGSTKTSWCDEFEALMKSRFQMSSMGDLTSLLDYKESNERRCIFISQVSSSGQSNDFLSKKSTQGGFQFIGRRLISWQCKKQTIVATSTTEAEYVATVNCCGQVIWIQNQMLDYGFNFMNTKIYIDNESTICIIKNPCISLQNQRIVPSGTTFINGNPYEKKLIRMMVHFEDPSEPQPKLFTPPPKCSYVGAISLDHHLDLHLLLICLIPFHRILVGIKEVTDQAKEIKHLKAQIKKLKKKAKPGLYLKHGEENLPKLNLQSIKKSLFDEASCDTLDYMDTEDVQDVGRTRDVVNEEKESAEDAVSTEGVVSTDKEKVSTDRTMGTVDQSKGKKLLLQPLNNYSYKFELMKLLLKSSSNHEAMPKQFPKRNRRKGVELKDVEETERRRPTSTRSLLTLKPLLKIDLKDKGKKKIEEEDESDTESEGIPEAEKKFNQLARDEEMARKVQEDWEAKEEVKKIAKEEAIKAALSNEYDFIQARIEADRLLALRLQDEEREQFTVEERAKFLHDTIAAQRRFLVEQRAIAIRSKPPTRTQLRNQIMTYLKHVGNKKHSDLKNKTFEDIQALYEKVKRFDESFTVVGSTKDERRIKEMNEEVKDPDQKSLKKRVVEETPKKEDTAKVLAKVDVTEQGTKKRKGGHMKMLARKKKRPQSDVDSNDEHIKCLKIVTFEGTMDSEIMERKSVIARLNKVSLLDGDYLVIYRANGNFRAFNCLLENFKDGGYVIFVVERRYHVSKVLLQRDADLGLEVERECNDVTLDLIDLLSIKIGEEDAINGDKKGLCVS
ncbi:putative ribonuclease H-like domain-containing protein [Tanacetum coccineum]